MSREPIFDKWRLITLLIFVAVLIPLGLGWRWVIDNLLSEGAIMFGGGIGLGVFLTLVVQRWEERRQRETTP